MKISYQWLNNYLNTNLSPSEISEVLTSTGLEVSEISEFQSVKGGLQGLVIGEVLSCEKHPDADKLSLTTVDVGAEAPLSIVCGAPNVAAGQKVIVAQVDTVLYSDEGSFTIKKSKIRGQLSQGMICAEDEIGLGSSHDGIMVLPSTALVGTPAAEYFNITSDQVFEVDLTANRIDAASHIGVARDLFAALTVQNHSVSLSYPSIQEFPSQAPPSLVKATVKNEEACLRYTGLTLTNLTVKESPDWLKNKLKAIGLKPINNVVDATNFVLHECAQPLHAFDINQVGEEVIIQNAPAGTRFVTLDGVEHILHEQDLMICNRQEPLCIAGVFGGLNSGVTDETTSIFLESACFHPVWIRKAARRHGLNTDASFRFERGVDPNNTLYALKRAALLIHELAGGSISAPIDIYPQPLARVEVQVRWSKIRGLIGQEIPANTVKQILQALEMEVLQEEEEGITVAVPTYRIDVTREADVIEDLLRIYGYNNIAIPSLVKSTLTYVEKPDPHQTKNTISDLLSSVGFHEIMCNSLTKEEYYTSQPAGSPQLVKILNPLSSDLNVMRQSLIFGGLESIAYNQNRKQLDLKLYEFGNCYQYNPSQKQENKSLAPYSEEQHLSLWLSGKKTPVSWIKAQEATSFFELKAYVANLLNRIGLSLEKFTASPLHDAPYYQDGLCYSYQNQDLLSLGTVHPELLKKMDVKNTVYYADIHWDRVFKLSKKYQLTYQEIAKFPEVKRDLSLLINQSISFEDLEKAAYKVEPKLLKNVDIFDFYEGKNLPAGKKSYALSFVLQDQYNTLVDKQIEKVMKKLMQVYEQDFGAQLR